MTEVLPPPKTAPSVPLTDQLGSLVHQRHAHRIAEAHAMVGVLIARCHAPWKGDDVAAIKAIDTLSQVGEYSAAAFSDDCYTAVCLQNIIAERDATEAEWVRLDAERNALVEEQSRMPNKPFDFRASNQRIAELNGAISRLKLRHETRSAKFKELAARSGRVYESLRQAGVDLRHR